MKHFVFVYGTLRPGGAAAEKMRQCRWLGSATVKGALFKIDWYPGLVLGGDGQVIGDLFEIPEEELDKLDAYEACRNCDPQPHEYRRLKTLVSVDQSEPYEAWVWEYVLPVDRSRRIESGDWFKCS